MEPTTTRRDRLRPLAAHLSGTGLDLGPGHQPFELPPGTSVRYVDRWQPEENRQLFPELGDTTFPRPDVIANFDVDRLAAVPSKSQDFVVCSHVLEHLAEPIGFLSDCYRVLRPGGLLLVLLPDRRRTFDRAQEATSLDHLLVEHRAVVTVVDDDHVRRFLTKSGPGAMFLEAPDGQDLATFYDWHRRQSIHVHYWTEDEFFPVVVYGTEHLGQRWALVDRLRCGDGSDEFGFVLRRRRGAAPRRWIRRRLMSQWTSAP